MRYEHVFIESTAYELPPNVVKTSTIEQQLKPILDKIGLPSGCIEAMTGLRERRFWDDGTRPSQPAVRVARQANRTAIFSCSS
jgi:3-oxoacyl-[acyl-carrier-protein] synthase-3